MPKPPSLFPRHAAARLEEALGDSPLALIHGPRQCGKTTLARQIGERLGFGYLSFDDDVVLASARADPLGFVAELPEKVILDEVQRVPALFSTLKLVLDRDRRPGRFILTASANVLLIPKLADSLAGRIEFVRLHPLSQCEMASHPPHFIESLFGQGLERRNATRLGAALIERIVAGGYPAALARTPGKRRVAWYRDYVEALVQRDVRDMARIGSLDVLPRLLGYAAAQTARLLNVSDLASPFHLSRPSIREYVTLLERIFMLEELRPWHSNRLSRLVKTPKLHLGDTGIACALMNVDAQALAADRHLLGQLLESFVFQELRRQASSLDIPVSFFRYRDKDGVEVDIVLESMAQRVAGIEVKASSTVGKRDFSGLRKRKMAAGTRFSAGVLLYDGEVTVPFAHDLHAVPISALWDAPLRRRPAKPGGKKTV